MSRCAAVGFFGFDDVAELHRWWAREEFGEDPRARACEDDFRPTDMRYQAQVYNRHAPQREARQRFIVECLRAKGADVADDLPHGDAIDKAVDAVPECIDQGPRSIQGNSFRTSRTQRGSSGLQQSLPSSGGGEWRAGGSVIVS